jgi:hypothetical protein
VPFIPSKRPGAEVNARDDPCALRASTTARARIKS